MRLALPLGLLGLTAIAALILIYILKPKYQEKKVSSTFVWKLSLRYRKNKIPLQWLRNSLLFLIQILIFAVIAFMMAQPYVVLASQSGEKIVILDASASMLAESGGKTRFERAKGEISSLVDITVPDDKFSIILAADEVSFVVRRSESTGFIKQKLFEAECSLTEPNYENAMALAEGVLAENPNAEVYLYTDSDYLDSGRVHVINVSAEEWNASVLNFSARAQRNGFIFTAEIACYGRDAEVAVGLNVDGKAQLPKLASCSDGETQIVTWELAVSEYESADVHLSADDSFVYDNEFYIYNAEVERFRVQLVSEQPGFLYSALSATGICTIDLPNETAPAQTSGYDLYVYDGSVPTAMPTDGAVWLVNPPQNVPSEWGIFLGGTSSGKQYLSSAGGSSETFNRIMRGISPDFYVTEYSRVVSYAGYESILKCGEDPVLLAKNEGGRKTVLFAFDLHMSDLPISYNYPFLISNLCKYSMSHTVEDSLYTVGDTVTINAKVTAQMLTVKAEYIAGGGFEESYTIFPVELKLLRSGVYTITQNLLDGRTVENVFFVTMPEKESVFGETEGSLVNPVVFSGGGTDTAVDNDTLDIYVYIAAAMLVLLCVEWGLQYREQY